MGTFLLWATLGIYAVGVVAVCLVAVLLALIQTRTPVSVKLPPFAD